VKYKEISVGISGVIPVASYENLRPSFSATIEVQEGDNEDDVVKAGMKLVNYHFDVMVDKAKVDLIEKQYKNIRFREIDGKKYPSVTSILSWDKEWKISEDELSQYAARGTIVHKLIELYLKDKKWINPIDLKEPEIVEAIDILMGGSLGLHWNQCSHEAFFKEFGDDIEIESIEQVVINKEVRYSGRYDIKGKYKGKKAIMDCKTGAYDLAQLAAYAVCEDKIEQLIVLPVGITTNKSGVMKPIVSDDIEGEFKRFLYAREKFRKRFGI
jgi:hypothetical protein